MYVLAFLLLSSVPPDNAAPPPKAVVPGVTIPAAGPTCPPSGCRPAVVQGRAVTTTMFRTTSRQKAGFRLFGRRGCR